MPLRPSLAKAHNELVSVMERVVREEGCTGSVLLLGERGVGKTLVRFMHGRMHGRMLALPPRLGLPLNSAGL